MRSFLYKQQLADSDFFESVEADADALAAPDPRGLPGDAGPATPLCMFDERLRRDDPPAGASRREEFATYLAGFAGGGH